MGNGKTITLVDGYKELGEVEMICAFKVPDLDGKYIIYTKNEHDKEGNTIIYSGKIITKYIIKAFLITNEILAISLEVQLINRELPLFFVLIPLPLMADFLNKSKFLQLK